MFGDLIPLPIDSSCPQFTSPKVGQEQGATTERLHEAKHYHAARQYKIHLHIDGHMVMMYSVRKSIWHRHIQQANIQKHPHPNL